MALGSNKPKQPTRAEIIQEAAAMDARRQEQIKRQSGVIDRLLTEHQILLVVVEGLAAESGNLLGYRDKAKEALADIEKLREEVRKQKEKQDGK